MKAIPLRRCGNPEREMRSFSRTLESYCVIILNTKVIRMYKRCLALLVLSLVLVPLATTSATAQAAEQEEPVEIYFFPGGSPGGSYATVVYNGAKHAAEILGDRVDVKYKWSDWSPQKMITHFQEAMAANPDGIAIMGHPGVETFRPFIKKARDQGIIVTSQDTPLPALEKKYKGEGFGYVGQNPSKSGYTLAANAVDRANLGEGDKAMVWGLKTQAGRGVRTRGAIKALKEAGLEVDYLEISQEVNQDPSAGVPVITGYVQSNPDVDLIITDHGGLTATQKVYFEAAGLGPDEVYGAGFDLSPATIDAIQSGYTDLVLDAQPFLQGFLPVYQIYLTERFKFSGLNINTASGLVHEGNIEAVAPLVEKGIR